MVITLVPIPTGVPPLGQSARKLAEAALGAVLAFAILLKGILADVTGSIIWSAAMLQLPDTSKVPPLPVHKVPRSPLRNAVLGTVTPWLTVAPWLLILSMSLKKKRLPLTMGPPILPPKSLRL